MALAASFTSTLAFIFSVFAAGLSLCSVFECSVLAFSFASLLTTSFSGTDLFPVSMPSALTLCTVSFCLALAGGDLSDLNGGDFILKGDLEILFLMGDRDR